MDNSYNMDMYFVPSQFIEWINIKYDEWSKGDPRRKKISTYARYIGVASQVMSNWLLGKVKDRPSTDNQQRLIDIYGPEAYAALGIPIPAGSIAYDALPSELRSRLDAALSELASVILTSGLDPDSPAAVSLSADILAKYGFKLTETETDE